jgi:hypothetical protein
MQQIEENLKQEETSFLQKRIRENGFIDEVAVIAKKILNERGAEIPIPETEEETEAKHSTDNKVSLILFVLFSSYAMILYFGEYGFSRFVLLTIALVGAVSYTRTLRK